MEELGNINIDLNEIISNFKKVGKATRTVKWFTLQQDTLLQLENRINMVSAMEDESGVLKVALENCNRLLMKAKLLLIAVKIEQSKPDREKVELRGQGMNQIPEEPADLKRFNLKVAAAIIKEFWGDGTRTFDYVESIQYYADQVCSSEHEKVVDYIYRVSLKGHAKESFFSFSTKPTSVQQISDHLLSRFKPKETLAGIQRQIASCTQGGRSVSGYVSELEQLGSKLIRIQVAELGLEAKEIVIKMTNQSLLSSFKQGLMGEARMVVLAANTKSFATAIEIAMNAEANAQDNQDSGFVNTSDHKRKTGKKFYGNGQLNNNDYHSQPNNNNVRGQQYQNSSGQGRENTSFSGSSGGRRRVPPYNNSTHRINAVHDQGTEYPPTQNQSTETVQNNLEFFR